MELGMIAVKIVRLFVCFWRDSPLPPSVGHGLLIHEVSRSHTSTCNSR